MDHGCQLELRNKKGFTALMLACRDGALPVVTFLVEQGADTDVVVPRTHQDCVDLAEASGNSNVGEFIRAHRLEVARRRQEEARSVRTSITRERKD